MKTRVLLVILTLTGLACCHEVQRAETANDSLRGCEVSIRDMTGLSELNLVSLKEPLEVNLLPLSTEGNLEAKNLGLVPIDRVLLLMELFDVAGNRLVGLPVNATTNVESTGRDEFVIPLSSLQRNRRPHIWKPNTSVHMFAYSAFAMKNCPAYANLTFGEIVFTNGIVLQKTAHVWQTDPVLDSMDSFWVSGSIPKVSRIAVRIDITEDGRCHISSESRAVPDIVSQAVAGWKFFPALKNGSPLRTTLNGYIVGSERDIVPEMFVKWPTPVLIDALPATEPGFVLLRIGGFAQ